MHSVFGLRFNISTDKTNHWILISTEWFAKHDHLPFTLRQCISSDPIDTQKPRFLIVKVFYSTWSLSNINIVVLPLITILIFFYRIFDVFKTKFELVVFNPSWIIHFKATIYSPNTRFVIYCLEFTKHVKNALNLYSKYVFEYYSEIVFKRFILKIFK